MSGSEQEVQATEVPTFRTIQGLSTYINLLVTTDHNFGTCVDAMSMAATAVFNFVKAKTGADDFMADLARDDIIRRLRGCSGPFVVIGAEEDLHQRCGSKRKLAEARADDEWIDWLKHTAKERLRSDLSKCHPKVVKHWRRLSGELWEPTEVLPITRRTNVTDNDNSLMVPVDADVVPPGYRPVRYGFPVDGELVAGSEDETLPAIAVRQYGDSKTPRLVVAPIEPPFDLAAIPAGGAQLPMHRVDRDGNHVVIHVDY